VESPIQHDLENARRGIFDNCEDSMLKKKSIAPPANDIHPLPEYHLPPDPMEWASTG
jgi:hypothetical protein